MMQLFHDLKVLLIEDDYIVQRVHSVMLTKLGCEVDVALTGEKALAMLEVFQNYQIIFVDIGLPDISGFDLIRMIKKIKLDFTRIIALTGYTGEQEERACLDAGASQVIYKPVVAQTMREILNTHLTSRGEVLSE